MIMSIEKTKKSVSDRFTVSGKTTVKKWGNSQGIRIPQAYLVELGIKENDQVELEITDNSLVIRKCRHFKDLKDRLEAFYGKNLDEIQVAPEEELDWGMPEGDEIW